MRRGIRFIPIILLLTSAVAAKANDVYIAQSASGSGNGSSCANAFPYSYFNAAGNWTSGVASGAQIGPGTTVHVCGTITVAAGATALTFQGSGTSGKVITLKFENGAVLASPAFSGDGGIVDMKNYTVIDGGTNGILENTANGTGLSYDQRSDGVVISGSNITLQNLTLQNMCRRAAGDPGANDCSGGGNDSQAIRCTSGCSNITLTKNAVSLGGNSCIEYGPRSGDSNVVISNNTLSGCNWGIDAYGGSGGTSSGLTVTGNDISCTVGAACAWDDPSDEHHHNGIFLFPQNGDTWNNAVIANNYIHDIASSESTSVCGTAPPSGAGCVTGYIFLDPSGTGNLPGIQIYNNLLVQASNSLSGPSNAFITDGKGVTGALIYNNTIYGTGSQGISAQLSPTSKNNIIYALSSGAIEIGSNLNTGYSNVVIDYNDYLNETAFEGSADNGTQFKTLAASQASGWCISTCDAHSLNVNPDLDSNYIPRSGSPIVTKGVNLSAAGISGLSQGAPQYFGVHYACGTGCASRPSSGAWDMGAYPSSSSSANNHPAAPTGLTGTLEQ